MTKSLKTVAKGYEYNTTYDLDPRRFESIIKVLEASRDNLDRACAVHICMNIDSLSFDKSLINKTLKKLLSSMKTRIWLLLSNGKE
ncbi:hypothetical protein [Acinetobacter soli]|uniref:hypothetical protein n=1 Tax=Acinetobacter soli TaxID=487316 RepID=UPI000DCF9B52|nr:hypothetical protein [Acinetobacter soli]